jgi:hypothetical protein
MDSVVKEWKRKIIKKMKVEKWIEKSYIKGIERNKEFVEKVEKLIEKEFEKV